MEFDDDSESERPRLVQISSCDAGTFRPHYNPRNNMKVVGRRAAGHKQKFLMELGDLNGSSGAIEIFIGRLES